MKKLTLQWTEQALPSKILMALEKRFDKWRKREKKSQGMAFFVTYDETAESILHRSVLYQWLWDCKRSSIKMVIGHIVLLLEL